MAADLEQRKRVIRYVESQMAALKWDQARLVIETDLDPKTVRSFLRGERWPQADKRAAIESALGLDPGTLDRVATGYISPEPDDADPVEKAIYASQLTRPNQLKLAGLYYEMLEAQERASTA